MSKKTLLNENTVRQFMKYANLGGLSDNFINENYMDEDGHEPVEEGMYEEQEGEEDVEEGMMDKVKDMAVDGAKSLAGKGIGAGAEALGAMTGIPGGGSIAKNLAGKATDAMGLGEEEDGMAPMGDDMPVDDAPEAPIDDMPVDDAPSEELPPEAISALERAVEKAADAMLDALAPFGVEGEASVEGDEAPMDDMGDMGDEAPMDDVDVIDEEEVVQETMKRVMNRLKLMKEGKQAEDKKSDMINSVADAIVARLRTKK